MALQQCDAFPKADQLVSWLTQRTADLPSGCRPDPHGRVQATSCYTFSIERNRVDLMIMSTKDLQTFPCIEVPNLFISTVSFRETKSPRQTHSTSTIVASACNLIPGNLDTPHGMLVTRKRMHQLALLHIPDLEA
jgi:hypothetical protein